MCILCILMIFAFLCEYANPSISERKRFSCVWIEICFWGCRILCFPANRATVIFGGTRKNRLWAGPTRIKNCQKKKKTNANTTIVSITFTVPVSMKYCWRCFTFNGNLPPIHKGVINKISTYGSVFWPNGVPNAHFSYFFFEQQVILTCPRYPICH